MKKNLLYYILTKSSNSNKINLSPWQNKYYVNNIYGHLEGVLEEKASFYDFGYNVFFNI